MGGLFSGFTDILFGGGGGTATTSGAFPNLGSLGEAFSQYALEQLETPAGETESFRLGSQAIREQLGGLAQTQRQALGDRATTGGFLDSGIVNSGNEAINRAETAAFSGALRDLILSLENRRGALALPFLQGGASENAAIQGMNIQNQTALRGQDMAFGGKILDLLFLG